MANETVEPTTTAAPEPAATPPVTQDVADKVVDTAPPVARATVPVSNSPIIRAVDAITAENNRLEGRPRHTRGVFSSYPMSTPKYARHRPNRRHEFEDTMARMFIPTTPEEYDAFVKSFSDPVTRSILRVLSGDNDKNGGNGYIDFLLTSAQHSFEERVQVTETLGDSYVAYFFGHAPPTFAYSGVLLNTFQDDWAMNMLRIYRDVGRGTQLARHNKVFKLRYDSMIVTGAMLNFGWGLAAETQTMCPFNFNFLVKSVQILYGGLSAPTSFPGSGKFAPDVFLKPTPDEQAAKLYIGTPTVIQPTTAKPLTAEDYYPHAPGTPFNPEAQMTMGQSEVPQPEPWENTTDETVLVDPATGRPYPPTPPPVESSFFQDALAAETRARQFYGR